MQSQITRLGWCLSASAARQGAGMGTPGCWPCLPSAPHWPWRDPNDSLLSLAVGADPGVGDHHSVAMGAGPDVGDHLSHVGP